MITHNLARPIVASAPVILIVDDDPSVLRLFTMAFQGQGFQVHMASSGEQAVALFRVHAMQIDMVLLDVSMPELDGPATLHQLQLINPGLLACFISGNIRNHSGEELLQRGALRLFSKPIPLGELTGEIKALLSSRLAHSA